MEQKTLHKFLKFIKIILQNLLTNTKICDIIVSQKLLKIVKKGADTVAAQENKLQIRRLCARNKA